jgi:hypothetical protein
MQPTHAPCIHPPNCARTQGLFERHKLFVATQLCMAVLRSRGELQRPKFDYLLHGPKEMGVDNPLGDWVCVRVHVPLCVCLCMCARAALGVRGVLAHLLHAPPKAARTHTHTHTHTLNTHIQIPRPNAGVQGRVGQRAGAQGARRLCVAAGRPGGLQQALARVDGA